VSPRARARLLTGRAAAAAAALVVGAAVLQGTREGGGEPRGAQVERPPPPLELGLSVRDDPEARALREAEKVFEEEGPAAARPRFEELLAASPESVEAAVGVAIAAWPDETVARLASGDREGAEAEWREVLRRDPDTPAALRAEDVLHPEIAPGRPPFVAPLEAPPGLDELTPAEQLAELERLAAGGEVDDMLRYGMALQRVGRPVSAGEAFAAASEAHPRSLPAAVAAALGRFEKDDPSAAFSRLGPLARRDEDGVVRYHLGLALSWIAQVEEAKRQLRQARDAGPQAFYGREAERLLERLEEVGS
jgi:tetratricopeptide (TPR) repeat protein